MNSMCERISLKDIVGGYLEGYWFLITIETTSVLLVEGLLRGSVWRTQSLPRSPKTNDSLNDGTHSALVLYTLEPAWAKQAWRSSGTITRTLNVRETRCRRRCACVSAWVKKRQIRSGIHDAFLSMRSSPICFPSSSASPLHSYNTEILTLPSLFLIRLEEKRETERKCQYVFSLHLFYLTSGKIKWRKWLVKTVPHKDQASSHGNTNTHPKHHKVGGDFIADPEIPVSVCSHSSIDSSWAWERECKTLGAGKASQNLSLLGKIKGFSG